MSGWAQFLVVFGALLQVGGLWLTVRQVRMVIGIRSTVWRQARDTRDRLLGRKSATVHVRTARAHATAVGQVRVDVSVPGESEVDRIQRDVEHHGNLIAELDRRLTDLDVRARYALEDRLDELNREAEETAQRNAELMLWGVALIGLGIVVQAAGSII